MKFLFLVCFFAMYSEFYSQVSINQDGSTPDASAILDLNSTDKGVLVPRISDTSSVTNPADGLMIFYTETNSFWYYNGNKWQRLEIGSSFESSSNGPSSIFYNGKIMEVSHQLASLPWSPSLATVSTVTTDGVRNTDAITAVHGAGSYCSYYCDTLTDAGRDDWYSPSRDELIGIGMQWYMLPGALTNPSSWSVNEFWSSTQATSVGTQYGLALTIEEIFQAGANPASISSKGDLKTSNKVCVCVRK
jgi:hypothetical protein